MVELWKLDGKVSAVKEAWLNNEDEVRRIVLERFLSLPLKEVPFVGVSCVTDKELQHFRRQGN